jgi:hypothetical protein
MNVSDAGPQTKLDPEPDALVAAMQELVLLMRQTVPELDERGLIMAGYVRAGSAGQRRSSPRWHGCCAAGPWGSCAGPEAWVPTGARSGA